MKESMLNITSRLSSSLGKFPYTFPFRLSNSPILENSVVYIQTIYASQNFGCSGTIFDETHDYFFILTAAHCVNVFKNPDDWRSENYFAVHYLEYDNDSNEARWFQYPLVSGSIMLSPNHGNMNIPGNKIVERYPGDPVRNTLYDVATFRVFRRHKRLSVLSSVLRVAGQNDLSWYNRYVRDVVAQPRPKVFMDFNFRFGKVSFSGFGGGGMTGSVAAGFSGAQTAATGVGFYYDNNYVFYSQKKYSNFAVAGDSGGPVWRLGLDTKTDTIVPVIVGVISASSNSVADWNDIDAYRFSIAPINLNIAFISEALKYTDRSKELRHFDFYFNKNIDFNGCHNVIDDLSQCDSISQSVPFFQSRDSLCRKEYNFCKDRMGFKNEVPTEMMNYIDSFSSSRSSANLYYYMSYIQFILIIKVGTSFRTIPFQAVYLKRINGVQHIFDIRRPWKTLDQSNLPSQSRDSDNNNKCYYQSVFEENTEEALDEYIIGPAIDVGRIVSGASASFTHAPLYDTMVFAGFLYSEPKPELCTNFFISNDGDKVEICVAHMKPPYLVYTDVNDNKINLGSDIQNLFHIGIVRCDAKPLLRPVILEQDVWNTLKELSNKGARLRQIAAQLLEETPACQL